MEQQLDELVDKVYEAYLETPSDRRLLVAIGGIPGSGKTTLATSLVNQLNIREASTAQTPSPSSPSSSPAPRPLAAYIPMDGYHLTRLQLSSLPDPATAHARRGAEFTFDGAAFLALITSLRGPQPDASAPEQFAPGSDGTIYAPSFDHALKDPVEGSIPILPLPKHRIVVVEGIYVLLDKEPWRRAAEMMDLRVWVEVDFETARRRLVRRHVASGICGSEEEADRRARENDLANGRMIVEMRVPVEVVVESREDEGWVHS